MENNDRSERGCTRRDFLVAAGLGSGAAAMGFGPLAVHATEAPAAHAPGLATPGVYARDRSRWVRQGLLVTTSSFPGRGSA